MLQKPLFILALVLTSTLLSGCTDLPGDPPMLAVCDTLECQAQQAWRAS